MVDKNKWKVLQFDIFLSATVLHSPPSRTNIVQVIPGQWYTARIEPMSFWRSQLAVNKPSAPYTMNLTFVEGQNGGSLAIYGKKGDVPSVTNYDWAHIVTGNGETRRISKRSSLGNSGQITLERTLTRWVSKAMPAFPTSRKVCADLCVTSIFRGEWFLAILNDNEAEPKTLRSVIDESLKWDGGVIGPSSNGPASYDQGACPSACNGRGTCEKGVCKCQPQFSGRDCSISKSFQSGRCTATLYILIIDKLG